MQGGGTVIAYTVPLFLRGGVITPTSSRLKTRIGASQFRRRDMGQYVSSCRSRVRQR